jgi:hypothetical protein
MAPMTPTQPRPPAADDSGLSSVIPYKNVPALVAYYCGVFAIIPCFFIGWAGLILGIIGLKRAQEHPEAKGKVHAWIGIIAGGLFALLYTAVTVLTFIAPMLAKH